MAAYRDAVERGAAGAQRRRADRPHDAALRRPWTTSTAPASADERARMAALLDACMADGAHGLSSGLFYEAGLRRAGRRGDRRWRASSRATAASTPRTCAARWRRSSRRCTKPATCAFEAGVPLVISHHKCAGPGQLGPHARDAAADRRARRSARPIAMDVYPYVAGSTVLREDLVDGVIDVMLTWSDPHPEVDGPHAGRHRRRMGRRPEGRLPPPAARRRLLLPDARGRRRARDRAPAAR